MHYPVLEKLWQRAIHPQIQKDTTTWNEEIEALYRLGISMEDTLHYLHFEKPALNDFRDWLSQKEKDTPVITDDIENVLSAADLEFWKNNGYIIVKGAISAEDCIATQQAIWDFLGANPQDKQSWYKRHEKQKGLMLNFSDHETLNRNRQSPRIRKAYEQLYQSTDIYKTIDKVSFNPPETDSFCFMGSALHWDMSLKLPAPLSLQGLLYLTDCGPKDGAFHCVPGFHNTIESWLEQLAPRENPREKAVATLNPIPIAANAGDFIIWDARLPHCATPNNGVLPRMVQYLTYLPNNYKAADEWL